MSIEAIAIALHHSRARGTAQVILLGIANHDGDGGSWPSHRTLAKYAKCDRSTVQRSIKRLISLGEIRVDVQAGGTTDWDDQLRPNLYHFLLECPAGCDRTKHHRMPGDTVTHNLWRSTGGTGAPAALVQPGTGGTGAAQSHPLQTPKEGPASSTGHARDETPLCSICSHHMLTCRQIDAAVPPDQRHEYDPVKRP